MGRNRINLVEAQGKVGERFLPVVSIKESGIHILSYS
jgi:hypothetical protein